MPFLPDTYGAQRNQVTEERGIRMAAKNKAPKSDFWKGVKSEFLKITWPDREDIGKQTVMVVFVSVALGMIIALIDFLLQMGVDYIVSVKL